MHIRIKNQLLSMMDSLTKMHKILLDSVSDADKLDVLVKCQEAAVSIGGKLESCCQGEEKKTVSALEAYCESVFDVYHTINDCGSADGKVSGLQESLDAARQHLCDIPGKYRVAFLPYKAEMWDSLESIWQACSKDENCECDVVPIPYFELNRKEQKWEPRYDGKRFPSYVPVTFYDHYKLEVMWPDIIYIHNPFDECNYVTLVHPYFHSPKLKVYSKILVYVPYYVTTGGIASQYLYLPGNDNSDYIIAQSEYFKSTCVGMSYYDKILPLGSPKFDRVIRMCRNVSDMPDEWKGVLAGKKVLMLNITLSDMLFWREILLDKMEHFFKYIQNQSRIGLIFRPHPLLRATIKSMRTELLDRYDALLCWYQENGIGVLDETPDIEATLAVSDGYIGSPESSVVNLFGVAGKPMFFFNNLITHSFPAEEQRRIAVKMQNMGNGRIYMTSFNNLLFSLDTDTILHSDGSHVEVCVERALTDKEYRWPYGSMCQDGEVLCITPRTASAGILYNTMTGELERVDCSKISDLGIVFSGSICCRDCVYMFLSNELMVVVYDRKHHTVQYNTQMLKALWEGVDRQAGMASVSTVLSDHQSLWLFNAYSNKAVKFDTVNNTCETYVIRLSGQADDAINGFASGVRDGSVLWLSDSVNGNVYRIDLSDADGQELWVKDVIAPPVGYRRWNDEKKFQTASGELLDTDNYIIATPKFANMLYRIDKNTLEVAVVGTGFLDEECEREHNGYRKDYCEILTSAAVIGSTHILVQRSYDLAAALIDIEKKDTVRSFYLHMPEEVYQEYTKHAYDGFEKAQNVQTFAMYESMKYPLDRFMQLLADNELDEVRERQLKALDTLAANMDGTCGEKVHAYMMQAIRKKYET